MGERENGREGEKQRIPSWGAKHKNPLLGEARGG